MPKFKPCVTVNRKQKEYKTYAEIKKNMRSLLKDSEDNEVFVSRSRRGEWGEWFEYWSLQNNKPVMGKHGWQ